MQHSEPFAEAAKAFVAAQAEFDAAALSAVNPHFKSKYAPFSEVMRAVRPALTKRGLAVLQSVTQADSAVFALTTTLLHTSGEWLAGTIWLPMPDSAQQVGSALTYARRYGLSALCGVVTEEDDDGTEAQQATPKAASRPAAPSRPAPAPTATVKGTAAPVATPVPVCPKCGGGMWDNRIDKKNPKAPDFKCKDKGCDGVVWPPKATPVTVSHTMAAPAFDEMPPELDEPDNENLPF